jgi:pimeloyl-ACP methyl ester carboxylesterase
LSYSVFTPSHRGGSGSPLVCLHGFMDTWRIWELVLPALERRHDVLAPTLLGHAGGPPLEGEVSDVLLADAVERAMDDAGFETAHIAGNSLGGFVALQLAARGRARSVVAFAPAGGWAAGDEQFQETLEFQASLYGQVKAAAPHAEARRLDRARGHRPLPAARHPARGRAADPGVHGRLRTAQPIGGDSWTHANHAALRTSEIPVSTTARRSRDPSMERNAATARMNATPTIAFWASHCQESS